MARFVRIERETLLLRLVAALGAAAALYIYQTNLTIETAVWFAVGYLVYTAYSLVLPRYILPRFPFYSLFYLMTGVDCLAVTGILFVTRSLDTAFTILFPIFIVYYSIHLGYRGSFVTAGVASIAMVYVGLETGRDLVQWGPLVGAFFLVATFGGYLGQRAIRQEAEQEDLMDLLRRRGVLNLPEPGKAGERALATVVFTDISDSTGMAARLGDHKWLELREKHHRAVREQLNRFGGREVKDLGDGFLMIFDRPAYAIQCCSAIVLAVREIGLEIRAGLHTGECELSSDDVTGIAVHIAARVIGNARPGEVLVSSTVKDLVTGSDIRFDDRGFTELKGLPGEWRLYAVVPEGVSTPGGASG